jgi:hypothetical protein
MRPKRKDHRFYVCVEPRPKGLWVNVKIVSVLLIQQREREQSKGTDRKSVPYKGYYHLAYNTDTKALAPISLAEMKKDWAIKDIQAALHLAFQMVDIEESMT